MRIRLTVEAQFQPARAPAPAASVHAEGRPRARFSVVAAPAVAPVADSFAIKRRAVPVVRAVTVEQLVRCRQLVYHSYLNKGYLQHAPQEARASGTFHDDQTHASPAARRRGQTFFVEGPNGSVLTTGTLVRDTPGCVSVAARNFGLPLDKAVPATMELVRKQLEPGVVLGEIGALASAPQLAEASPFDVFRVLRRGEPETHPLTALFMAMHQHAEAQGITDIVVGVNPAHALFYRKMGFTEMAGATSYQGLQNADVVVLHTKTKGYQFRLMGPGAG